MKELSRIVNLSDDEIRAIRDNEEEFAEAANLLISEYKKFEEFQAKLKKLNIRYNDDTYKRDFAANEIRKNLERISALLQKTDSKSMKIDAKIKERLEELLNKYSES